MVEFGFAVGEIEVMTLGEIAWWIEAAVDLSQERERVARAREAARG